MIDKTLITRKSKLIIEDLKELEAIGCLLLKEFLNDHIQQVLAERYLERAIGRMIDINYHLLIETDKPPPADYFTSFTDVGKLGVLPAEYSRDLARAAGLRNRLVHEYDKIDNEKLYEGVKFAVKDIPIYLDFIEKFIAGI